MLRTSILYFAVDGACSEGVLPASNALRFEVHPRCFYGRIIQRENTSSNTKWPIHILTVYKRVFLAHRHFLSSGPASFLVLSAPWHAGSPPGHHGASLALGEVRGTCSGRSKCQVPTGSDSEYVEPSRPMQTRVQVKRMSDGSCDVWDLECRQCRQTLRGDGNVERIPDRSCTG